MASSPGTTPSPQEPFVNPQTGAMTRTWYRVINALSKNAGKLAAPITVKPNSFFVSGDLNSGGTLEPNTIPPGTLLGNSSDLLAAASPLELDPSLSLNNGSLAVAPILPMSILGNAANDVATPGAIVVGSGLTLVPGSPPVLNATTNSSAGSSLAGAQTLSWWRQ